MTKNRNFPYFLLVHFDVELLNIVKEYGAIIIIILKLKFSDVVDNDALFKFGFNTIWTEYIST